MKDLCNHELIDSHDGENECELEIKVQNIEDFEQSNLFDEHISVSELNNNHANVKGRLKENVTFREQIGATSWMLNILKEGYSLLFVKLPPKIFFKNKSALKSADFVTLEVFKLLERGCIREIVKRNDSLFWLSENKRGRMPCSYIKKSGSSGTLQLKAASEELHFIHFLGFQLAAV